MEGHVGVSAVAQGDGTEIGVRNQESGAKSHGLTYPLIHDPRKKSGRWGPYRQASPPPARRRPGARSARRGMRHHGIADRLAMEAISWRSSFRVAAGASGTP